VDGAMADAVRRITAALAHANVLPPVPPEGRRSGPVATATFSAVVGHSNAPLSAAPGVRGRRFAAAALLAVLGTVVLASTHSDETRDAVEAALPAADRTRTLVIMPFADSSPSPSSRYFARALTAQLTRELGGIASLRLLRADTAATAELRLTGVVRLDDGRFEIDADLVEGRDGRVVWTARQSGAQADLPGSPAAVARDVVAALDLPLTPAERRRFERVPTTNAAAYALYLRSTALSTVHRSENLAGIDLLRQAPSGRDGAFAFALATLARRFMFHAYLVDPAFGDSGMAAAQRAIAVDPALGEGWFALGDLQGLAGHPSSARLSYLKALDVDPGHLPAMVDLSDVNSSLGRYDEALYWALRAVRQDPTSPGFRSHLVVALYYLGVDEATERSLLDAERRWPEYERFPVGLARLDYIRGRDTAAVGRLRRYVARDPGNEEAAVALAAFAALTGAADGEALVAARLRASPGAILYGPAKESFLALLALTRRRRGDLAGARVLEDSALAAARASEAAGREDLTFATERAAIHAIRGDAEAITWLERAYAAGEKDHRWLAVDPFFASVRRLPRFTVLLSRTQSDIAAMRRRAIEADDSVFRIGPLGDLVGGRIPRGVRLDTRLIDAQ
jgi:TolB-like protein